MKRVLTPLQERAIGLMRLSLSQGKTRPMLQAPTGFGKTVIASAVCQGALAKNNRVNIVVPAITLINQTVASLARDGFTDVGVIQANHPLTNPNMPIQVCSVQSLAKRRIPHADIVLIDEAHRLFEFHKKWMTEWNDTPFIGLSATPWSAGLGNYFDDLIVVTTTGELIEMGHLSPFRVFAPNSPDLSGCRSTGDDWNVNDLSDVMNQKELVADVVQNWLAHASNRPTLCFCVDRAHARAVLERFREQGVRTAYIDAFTPTEEREIIGENFNACELQVVVSVGCLTTGIDWDVRSIILARPTKSEILFVQIIGRGLRTARGKDNCLIFDHTDTHSRLGHVTDISHAKLSTGKAPKSSSVSEEKLPRPCSKCTFMKPASTHACPACGFCAEKQSKVKEIEGELVEMHSTKSALNRKTPVVDKARFYAGLRAYQIHRGYADGWSANQYKNKFGVWPNSHKDTQPQEPTPEVLNWIKSRQIAFAKSKLKKGMK